MQGFKNFCKKNRIHARRTISLCWSVFILPSLQKRLRSLQQKSHHQIIAFDAHRKILARRIHRFHNKDPHWTSHLWRGMQRHRRPRTWKSRQSRALRIHRTISRSPTMARKLCRLQPTFRSVWNHQMGISWRIRQLHQVLQAIFSTQSNRWAGFSWNAARGAWPMDWTSKRRSNDWRNPFGNGARP